MWLIWLTKLIFHTIADNRNHIILTELKRLILEVTIARKVLPHSQGIKEGSMRNLLNNRLFLWSRFAWTSVRQDDLDLSQ
jgi:hypothetical protein